MLLAEGIIEQSNFENNQMIANDVKYFQQQSRKAKKWTEVPTTSISADVQQLQTINPEKRRIPVIFELVHPTATAVFVTGSWCDWNERYPLIRGVDSWHHIQLLSEGSEIQYKFIAVVSGRETWLCSPAHPTADDGRGNINNTAIARREPSLSPVAVMDRKGHGFRAMAERGRPL
ncbi:5'-AMP-activated protein kinase, beta-1 subunit [Carpediemonas membranifera]|uniref:5'-AMP-activated protein kinase, beta-1 subunit n=1 Tax=Carpediemonas membranifera TaxID=201153 RepID=A0A8J6BVJ5_9EUKA|nr:5'-AMP-activated protein kinase, beta-1 subunit [Carpediemonas membranifera]|eukprot:KAG9391476.1 5'-AMP-activated protein kinase, beta-1 subunit [Carpediemonas membranifera]